jgi:hypothetical protein
MLMRRRGSHKAGAWRCAAGAAALLLAVPASALDRPEREFRVFQFTADAIPRIDGRTDDWAMVGDEYAITGDMMTADDGSGSHPDPRSLTVKVRVGWVKGLNRLYVLYEATDDYWDFGEPGIHNDTFELAVDGDRSGGPFIARFHPDLAPKGTDVPASSARYISKQDAWFGFQNVSAQNYHIFTPARDKDWAMAWGPQAGWLKRLPWSNIAYHHDVQPGRPGKVVAEFWITPFDHADPSGPGRSVESTLTENAIIGLAWAVIDYDGPSPAKPHFWNLSSHHTMYGQASQLCAFRLMPLAPAQRAPIRADWSFIILDRDRRVVAFHDDTLGRVEHWRWDFGDGERSDEQHPVHRYATPGKFVVTLRAAGPDGASTLSKVWDVSFTGDPTP